MKHKLLLVLSILTISALTPLTAFAAPSAEKQAYRLKATEIRQEIKEVNTLIKDVNAQIKEIRENFLSVRDGYKQTKQLPSEITTEEWNEIKELRKQITAINQDGKVVETEDKTETEEPVTVKEFVASGDYDGALALLKEKKETRLSKLAKRTQVLEIWKEIDALMK